MDLTPEEQELLESVENGEWETIPDFEEHKKLYQSYTATLPDVD